MRIFLHYTLILCYKRKQLLSGYVGSLHITQGFVLVGAVLLETVIAMVLLSRVLKYRVNRWANIIVGVLQIASIGADYVIDYTQEDFTKNGQHYSPPFRNKSVILPPHLSVIL